MTNGTLFILYNIPSKAALATLDKIWKREIREAMYVKNTVQEIEEKQNYL